MSPDTSYSLINLGDLSEPANILLKKISNAAGVLFEPHQIKRVAKAKAEAARIEAQSEIEITDLHRRAARRWIEEEATQQKNMEDITAKALPHLDENAKPDSMENDWIVNFFDKSRIVSDMRCRICGPVFWPAKRTPREPTPRGPSISFRISIRAKPHCSPDFVDLGFVWSFGGGVRPLVFDFEAEIYNRDGIDFQSLSHLESIGLIQVSGAGYFEALPIPKRFAISYYGKPLVLELPKDSDNEIRTGKALLTRIGQELAPICGSKPVEGFWEYVRDKWKNYLPQPESEKMSASGSDKTNTPSN